MGRSSRSKYKRRSNRSAKILTTAFSIVVVVSFILSLIGPYALRRSQDPTPIPTRIIPTVAPLASPTPLVSATPTPGIPTPVLVTPTKSP